MEIRNDFKELLDLFNKHKVEYLIVDGIAYFGSIHVTVPSCMAM